MRNFQDVLPIVQTDGRIKIKPGITNWTGTITQPVKLDAPIGHAIMGQ